MEPLMLMEIEMSFLELRYSHLRVQDRGRQTRLAASLDREGQRTPVLVVPLSIPPGRYVLIDGYGRVAALRSLHRDLVTALVLEMGEPEALVVRHRLESCPQRAALEEAWLVQALIEMHHRTQQDVAGELGKTRSWVSRRLALVKTLPEEAQQAVREGRIPPNAAEKFLVPLARANEDHCRRLVQNLGKFGMHPTVREVQRLWRAWKTAPLEGREPIVERPDLFLQVDEAVSPPFEDLSLFTAMEAVSGACVRARKLLRNGALTELAEGHRDGIRGTWEEAQRAFEGLSRVCSEEGLHAGR
jgi:ParB/RepB/Spo0J family partition protein